TPSSREVRGLYPRNARPAKGTLAVLGGRANRREAERTFLCASLRPPRFAFSDDKRTPNRPAASYIPLPIKACPCLFGSERMPGRYLITGATGFVGSHIAEACAARGIPVSTLSRPGSDTTILERLGVTVHRGDLTDPQAVRPALEGADIVVHCAA